LPAEHLDATEKAKTPSLLAERRGYKAINLLVTRLLFVISLFARTGEVYMFQPPSSMVLSAHVAE
jgi:hypothetical protein